MANMFSVILIHFLLFFLQNSKTQAQSSLNKGSSLKVEHHDQPFLVSEDQTFSCGFYQVSEDALTFAIWFSKSINKSVVWTANRDSPVNGHGSKISFQHDGNLVLKNVNGYMVWSTMTTSPDASTILLNNNGNLVVSNTSGNILWQSFDSPTDTLLPNQPLTKEMRVVSAMARGGVSSGYYSLYFDSDNVLKLIYDGPVISSIYWPNPGNDAFQNGRTTYNTSRFAVLDETGVFNSSDQFSLSPSDLGAHGIKRRLKLDFDDNLRMFSLNKLDGSWEVSWEAFSQPCSIHGLCGENGVCQYSRNGEIACSCLPGYEMKNQSNWNEGCKPEITYNCNATKSRFVEFPQVNFYEFDLAFNSQISYDDCANLCIQNCNCKGFSYWMDGEAFGGSETIFLVIGWWYILRERDEQKLIEEGYKKVLTQFRRFTYRELKEATGNFKEEIGTGSSGVVYRGVLADKRVVAIKKLNDVNQGEEEFLSEVNVIGHINHINLLRMFGICSERQHKLIVYEHMENQSLDKFLFKLDITLQWRQRFKIALGVAKGLAYLHHTCMDWIIHCDVKPENILLARDFEPKIADFGLAKLSKRDRSGFDFSRMRGTSGYMAPEWILQLPITSKVDVYSYGVVVLELVMGTQISSWVSNDGESRMKSFATEVRQILKGGDESAIASLADVRLQGQFDYEQLVTMLRVATSCLEEQRNMRPTMNHIVKDLIAFEEG